MPCSFALFPSSEKTFSELVKAADELAALSKELKGRPNKELTDLTRKIRELAEKYR